MNFLNIFEDHVAGIFGATRAPFSFKKLAKQAARDMEDQTLVINGVNTAPALYTILIAADDDPMLAPFYPELSREVREFVKAQAEKHRYVFVGEPLVRFMIDPQLRAGKFSVFAENVDAPTLGRLYEEERAYQNGLGQNNSAASRAASAPRAGQHGTWITDAMREAYGRLHRLGHAHSIEVRDGEGRLAGGLYGVAMGRMFFGESMFSARSGGSKVALAALAHVLRGWDWPLVDAQVENPHLVSLGATSWPRARFLAEVRRLAALPGRPGPWTEAFGQLRATALREATDAPRPRPG